MDENYLLQAEQIARAEVDAALARARQLEPTPTGFAGVCECGEEILPARIALGHHRCLACQTLLERKSRQFR